MASIEIRQVLKLPAKRGFLMSKELPVSTHTMLNKKTAAEKPVEQAEPEKTEETSAIGLGQKGSGPQQPSAIKLRVHKEE